MPIAGKKKEGRGWRLVAIVLMVIIGLITVVELSSMFSGALGKTPVVHNTGPKLFEVVMEDNDSSDKVLVIHVQGVIQSGPAENTGFPLPKMISEQLKHAAADSHIKAVVLRVDSPGGEVLASDEIARSIEKFQKDSSKPVVAAMGSLAASGGYYVSAPCRWIIADELTITGSIGVIMHGYNYRGLMNKVGVQPEVFKSGKFKDMLSGDKDLTNMTPAEKDLYAQERKMVQDLIDETYGKFKSVVQRGREAANRANGTQGKKLDKQWADLADGRILSGKQALEHGFVDELGTFEDALKRARTLAGIESADVIEYQVPFDFMNVLRLFGKTSVPAIKVELGLDTPKIKSGRMYFLSPVLPW